MGDEQLYNPTRKFRFLTPGPASGPLSPETLERLLARERLGAADLAVAEEIIETLRRTGDLPFSRNQQEDDFLRSNPEESWLGYLIYRYKFKLPPERRQVADFPVYVLIEPVSTCNLRCVMCFQIDRSFTRKPHAGVMDMGLYRKIIDELAAEGTKAITFASRGEPTLHPQLDEMLAYAAGTGRFYDIKLNTNATRLDEKLCHAILSSGVNELVFSVDAHEKALYEEIRVNGDFDAVLRNIRRFHEIRARDYPQSRLRTRVSGVKFRPDQDGAGFIDFWSKIVDRIAYTPIENRWDTYNSPPLPEMTESCVYLWDRLYIWFDGLCNPCDVDYKSRLSLGKFPETSIRDIWRGPAMTAMREAHLAGRRCDYTPCDRCGV